MPRSYADRDLKLLWGLAAARCAFPKCQQQLVIEKTEDDPAVIVGQIAHIVAHSDEGPRANPAMSVRERDKYDNLILLCSTHHDQVDGQPNTYTITQLRQWKSDHEKWVQTSLAEEITQVTFAELEVVTSAILAAPIPSIIDFSITSPAEKMRRNGLTDKVHFLLTMGLSKAKEVSHFVEHVAVINPDFPEQLTAGFLTKYRQAQQEGLSGDALFETVRSFASGGTYDLNKQAAGLAVVSYLFEKCELFER